MSSALPVPEFSVEIRLDALPRDGKRFALCASPDERIAIAERLGIPAVDKLAGDVRLVATRKAITARGHLDAALTRICVASLEEMSETVDESFEIEFFRTAPARTDADANEAWEQPEVHEGDTLDLGELLVQQLALAMAQFPRKPDAASLAEKYGRAKARSPFAALAGKIEKSNENQ